MPVMTGFLAVFLRTDFRAEFDVDYGRKSVRFTGAFFRIRFLLSLRCEHKQKRGCFYEEAYYYRA